MSRTTRIPTQAWVLLLGVCLAVCLGGCSVVHAAAPVGLTYTSPCCAYEFTQGDAITIEPGITSGDDPTSYTITPAIPELTIDVNTGIITGMCSVCVWCKCV